MVCFALLLFFANASSAIANGDTINVNTMTIAVDASKIFVVFIPVNSIVRI